ncbi:MAG: glycosyltransferase [Pseudomonadota bacterium]
MSDFPATLIMPIYNQAAFIGDAVRATLAQDCPSAEILISDDCSPDNTFDVARAIVDAYTGPHRVRIWRNAENLGTGNLPKCVAEATHDRIIQFHGDDISHPNRARRINEAFDETGASVITSNSRLINEAGEDYGPLLHDTPSQYLDIADLAEGWQRMQSGSTLAFNREVFDRFLPWTEDAYWLENDNVLPFRAALLGGAYYLGETLLDRRQHKGNFGKEARAATDDDLQVEEFRLAKFLALRAFLLRDLAHFVDANGDGETAQRGRERLQSVLETKAKEWAQARSTLLNHGMRPTWVTTEALKQQATATVGDISADARALPPLRRLAHAIFRRLG